MGIISLKSVAKLAPNTSVECSADLGQKPELVWLPVTDLVIDPRYQRDVSSRVSRARIARILKNFKWRRFQPPTVAATPDGYAVLDGQHRVAAARLHPGIGEIPCYHVGSLGLEDQADTFVQVNRERGPVSPMALYYAQLAGRDETALRIRTICAAAKVTIARCPVPGGLPPGQTYAVGRIGGCLGRYGVGATRSALKILVKAAGSKRDQLRASLIGGTAAFIHRYRRDELYRDASLCEVLALRPAVEWLRLANNRRVRTPGASIELRVRDMILTAYRGKWSMKFGLKSS